MGGAGGGGDRRGVGRRQRQGGIRDRRKEMGQVAGQATEEWSREESMSNLLHVQYPQARANYERRWSVRLWRRLVGRRKWNIQAEPSADHNKEC